MNTLTGRMLAVLSLAVVLLSACASAVSNPASLEEFNAASTAPIDEEYKIQPGDQLDIKFFYNPELNEQITVRPDGRITMQLANDIMVSGLTTAQLTDVLKEKYSKELEDPEISVIVRSFSAQKVYVDGEVGRPGTIALSSPMTVLQSISQAGGVKDTARLSEVIVMRRSEKDPNKMVSVMVDLEKALDGTDKKQDLELRPYDIVYVPKKHVSNLNSWVDQYIRKNLPVSLPFGMF